MDLADFYLVMYALYALLYAIGFIVALAYWRRAPRACGLMLTATALNLAVTLARAGLHYTVMANGFNLELGLVMGVLTFAQWIGLGLIVLAVFVGRGDQPRRPPHPFRLDDDWDEPAPRTDGTRIRERR
jgi:hypothetical protein